MLLTADNFIPNCPPPQKEANAKAKLLDLLTPREKEVLSLLARGYNNNEIAACLHISKHTVKNHVSNIYHKLEMDDRTQIALLAVRNGFVKLD
ncbi:MAG: response regulator transcription factor [Firmicutes bacterium]|nr:response regulator transcription factor [Bacillota bacterium]